MKANEVPIPRGAAAKKRRISEEDPAVSQRRMKKDSNSEGSLVYNPLQHRNSISGDFGVGSTVELQDLAFSAQQALDHVHDDDVIPIDPSLQAYSHGNDTAMMDASPRTQHRDAVMFSVEDIPHDPMEGVDIGLEARSGPVMEPLSPGSGPNGLHVQLNGATGAPSSPRASRNGIQFSPLTPNAQRSGWPGPSGRKASQAQTPHRPNRKSNTPKTPSTRRRDSKDSIKLEPRSEPKARATSSAIVDSEEDMASLALAMQLQMEEHGLRRRSMV